MCPKCSRCFAHRQGKSRHLKTCKGVEGPEKAQQIIECMQRYLTENSEPPVATDRPVAVAVTNNNTGPTTNNINITNNNNIILCNFGYEQTPYICREEMQELCDYKDLYDALFALLIRTHFNPDHPENMTMYLKDAGAQLGAVFAGSKWEKVARGMMVRRATEKAAERMSDVVDGDVRRYTAQQHGRLREFFGRTVDSDQPISDGIVDEASKVIAELSHLVADGHPRAAGIPTDL